MEGVGGRGCPPGVIRRAPIFILSEALIRVAGFANKCLGLCGRCLLIRRVYLACLAVSYRPGSLRFPDLSRGFTSPASGLPRFASLGASCGFPALPCGLVGCSPDLSLPRRVLRAEKGLCSHLSKSAQCGTSGLVQGDLPLQQAQQRLMQQKHLGGLIWG